MPARRVLRWEPEEQWTSSEEREKKIEELSRELDESIGQQLWKRLSESILGKK